MWAIIISKIIDLSKQQALDADPKAIQQINFAGNLAQEVNEDTTFIIEPAKKNVLDFSRGIVRVLWMSSCNLATACSASYFCLNIVSA